jgi:hypothetical protein
MVIGEIQSKVALKMHLCSQVTAKTVNESNSF